MFEQIINLLKTFFEKYFIQSLIAILLTILIFYYTPDSFNFMIQIGNQLYCIFLFILIFLLIELLIYLFNTVSKNYYQKKFVRQEIDKNNMQTLKYIWNYVDSLNNNEKRLLNYMLENNNKTINISGSLMHNRLYDDWFNQTQIISDGTIPNFDIYNIKEKSLIESGCVVTQYKLKDDIYDILSYSKKKYGKISNFQ